MKIRLDIAYKGTPFCGWQRQNGSITVQQVMEESLSKIFSQQIFVTGCGRTDSGVHASHYVLDFSVIDASVENWLFRLNQLLPPEIAAIAAVEVAETFHSRFDAKKRTYIYKINLNKNPFLKDLSYFSWKQPNIEWMNMACETLKKYTDFETFCKAGGNQKTTICEIYEAFWTPTDDGMEFQISANRFLRNMVRSIVGTMLDIGFGRMTLDQFDDAIQAKDRTRAGKSAPACGLYLAQIIY